MKLQRQQYFDFGILGCIEGPFDRFTTSPRKLSVCCALWSCATDKLASSMKQERCYCWSQIPRSVSTNNCSTNSTNCLPSFFVCHCLDGMLYVVRYVAVERRWSCVAVGNNLFEFMELVLNLTLPFQIKSDVWRCLQKRRILTCLRPRLKLASSFQMQG